MEWWQHLLFYLGIWIFGVLTGRAAGIAATLLRYGHPHAPAANGPTNVDLDTLRQLSKMMPQGDAR